MMVRRTQGLSERHRKILEFLSVFQDKHGYSPSIRQIGDSINVKSTSLVDYYLGQLADENYISREGRVSRSIRVLKPLYPMDVVEKAAAAARDAGAALRDLVTLPLKGRIVASEPIPMPTDSGFDYYDPDSVVDVARSMLAPREKVSELFALEVQGDSMIDAMINDGDIIILKPAVEANNGEMVAVWLDDRNETTLKYFYREGSQVRLQPANPTMGPIIIKDPSHLRIMGKVVLVIRQMPSTAA